MVGRPDVRDHRDRYRAIVAEGRVDEAVGLCLGLLERGASPEDITLDILRPTQREVGERWALGALSVAREHAATAVTDAALDALGAATPAPPRGPPVVVACPEGEWHCLAGRMVAQLLRWRGIAAQHVGTLACPAALDELIAGQQPRALALSCSTTAALPGVARAVGVAARRATPLLAGGAGFGPAGRYAACVGVPAWDGEVPGAVRRLARWDVTGPPRPGPPPPETIAYRRLLRRRAGLVEEVTARLAAAQGHRVGPAVEAAQDVASQVVALALAAARTSRPAILRDGLDQVAAALAQRPEPVGALAGHLAEATRVALGGSG